MTMLLLRQKIKNLLRADVWRQGKWKNSSVAQPIESVNVEPTVTVGAEISGFTVEKIESVPEFQLTAYKLRHRRTGGEYLHIARDDSNNVFSVLFRTTPQDSTGLPHILEHTTLTGSAKYPCRDPFFKMLNRSMATFMNAMTGPDFTLYPFSTQNQKDYENLMSVYLDAAFRPNLRDLDFNQEGWRLEHEDVNNPESAVIIKGVVFNEMKGVFSDNQYIFWEALLNNLLPSHTYSVCSGGDPLVIPQLTLANLQAFHKDYYSPSNTKYYSYGNFPLTNHLQFIEKEYLSTMQKHGKVDTRVPSETRWTHPVRKHITCRVDPMAPDQSKQSSIVVSHLCCSITEVAENFALQVISELLVSGPNAAFYKTLVEPNIGAGLSPTTGFEAHTRDTFFTVGLQGVAESDFERIVTIFDETIREVVKKGFDQGHIDSVLHGIELNTKHQTANFGLGLIQAITPLWNHDGDVLEALHIDRQVATLRSNMANNPKYLQETVKKHLLDNKHRLILTMSPDPSYEETLQKEEEKLLKAKLDSLNEKDKKRVFEDGLRLIEYQQRDDKECLPTLNIEDLNKLFKPEVTSLVTVKGVPVQVSTQPTNGVTYLRGLLSSAHVKDELKPYLPLFARMVNKMGTKRHNYREFDQLVFLKTGGINFETHLKDSPAELGLVEENLAVSSYCLDHNVKDMLSLLTELLTETDLTDVKRFETLLASHAADLVNGVTHSGHHYAMLSAAALISPSASIKERCGGLTYVDLVKTLVQRSGEETLGRLGDIRQATLNRSRLKCAVNILESMKAEIVNNCESFVGALSGDIIPVSSQKLTLERGERGLYYILPFSVSFTAKSLLAVPYQHEDFAPLRVLSRLASMNYLHPEIREKGGAYGSGMSLSASGVISFYSYRDPNPVNSLKIFDSTCNWVEKASFTEQDLSEAKLGTFQSIDAPVPPGDKGMRTFLYGVTDEMLQEHRLRLMAVTKDQIIEVSRRYLNNDASSVGRTVIGPDNETITSDSSIKWKKIVQK